MRATEHLVVVFFLKCVVVNADFPSSFEYKSRKIFNVDNIPINGKKTDVVLPAEGKLENGLKNTNETIERATNKTKVPSLTEKVVPNEKPPDQNPKINLGIIRDNGFNSGALLRGFIVFVGLSMVVMLYIVCRSYK